VDERALRIHIRLLESNSDATRKSLKTNIDGFSRLATLFRKVTPELTLGQSKSRLAYGKGVAALSMNRLVYVLDDDPVAADICASILRSLQCRAEVYEDVEALLARTQTHPPDAIFIDELTPGVDGLQLSRRIRNDLGLSTVKLVVIEDNEAAKAAASHVVADARLAKPFGHEQVRALLSQLSHGKAEVRFWGVRGSIAAPGAAHDRYGGNTSCISIRLALDEYIVFDAGTGIREFGNYLIRLGLPVRLHLLITHAHWDHIQGWPFFRPGYLEQNDIAIYGPDQPGVSFEKVIADQMQNTYFPVPLTAMQANLHFHTLVEGAFQVAGYQMRAIPLHHPGSTLGYRLTIRGKSIAYICDNEIEPGDDEFRARLRDFIRNADVVVADAQYIPEDFPGKRGWGHSKYTDVVDTALEAGVHRLVLTHHDPDRNDDALDAIVEDARARIAERLAKAGPTKNGASPMECSAAAEGTALYL
jgi:phosphoribosyl 1,2-cyclic phosphodiesterase